MSLDEILRTLARRLDADPSDDATADALALALRRNLKTKES